MSLGRASNGHLADHHCTYGAGPPVIWAAKPSVATSSHGVAVTSTSTVVGVLSPARSPNHYGGARSIIAASAAGVRVR